MEPVQNLENLINAGDYDRALDFVESLSLEERRQWQIQNLTGVVCAYCGEFEAAETFFSAVLEQQPADCNLMYNLADTLAAQGKTGEAQELLRRCEQYDSAGLLTEDIAILRKTLAGQAGKQVLMAAYFFPPLSGSGVFRSIKFAKYLLLFGWRPTVISTDQPPNGWSFADRSQMEEIPNDMPVVRLPDRISTGRKTSFSEEQMRALLGFLRDVLRYSGDADAIFSQMMQVKAGIEELLIFPCAALLWAYDAVQYIEKNIDLSRFQIVYTTSGPASAHLIGFYLRQKYGIPWVADYRDPWTYNPYGGKYDPSNPRLRLLFELEKILLHCADCNLTVADGFTKTYIQNFKLPAEKIVSITNGYDNADFADFPEPPKTEKFTINYSGLLYTGNRSITPVLTALQQLSAEQKMDLSTVCFRIVGYSERDSLDVARQYGLEAIMEQTGYLSHREALLSNLNADLLLLLVGDEPKYQSVYTGKLFDYLRSGRPILALAPKGGVVDKVLRESGHGRTFRSTQTGQIKAMILREYQKWQMSDSIQLLHSPAIEKFERKVLTKRLAQVFESVAAAPHRQFEIPSSIYDRSYQSGGIGNNYHNHYTQSFYYPSWQLAMTYLRKFDCSTSILEIACGAGQFANMLFDNGYSNYIGFDFSAEAIILAKKNNPQYADRFFVDDAFETELLKKPYDLVLCFEALEHIQNDLELLGRIHSGTKVILSVPNFSDPYHVCYFRTIEEVRNRYQNVINISEIVTSKLNHLNCLYYIVGEKL